MLVIGAEASVVGGNIGGPVAGVVFLRIGIGELPQGDISRAEIGGEGEAGERFPGELDFRSAGAGLRSVNDEVSVGGGAGGEGAFDLVTGDVIPEKTHGGGQSLVRGGAGDAGLHCPGTLRAESGEGPVAGEGGETAGFATRPEGGEKAGGTIEDVTGLELGQHGRCFVFKSENEATAMLPKLDRKSTRLNSSHQIISYAVFCLKKKRNT